MIPSSTFLYGTIGRPIVFSGFSSGKIFLISFHRSSGMRVIILTYLFTLKQLSDMIRNQRAIFLSIFGIGSKSYSTIIFSFNY